MAEFELIKKCSKTKARVGRLHTAHGSIDTPVFMPVGTQATVKALTPQHLEDVGSQIILSNTYHLALRPGPELIEAHGGLHPFMNWEKPILTDSGGFQVFSLEGIRDIDDAGVTFRSHLDGSKHRFTPKKVIDLQRSFRSDIMMPLDICTPYGASERQVLSDMARTTEWEREAFKYWQDDPRDQLLFGLVQGGMHETLREEHAGTLSEMDFSGFAIGGVSVGEPIEDMHRITAFTAPLLPEEKPRYLMGVGLPENLDFAIAQGIDMFDCVVPTRLARHGQVFSSAGKLTIKNAQYATDLSPLDEHCHCYTCQNFSKAYLRHLFMAREILAMTLLSLHNVQYLIRYVDQIREAILET